MVANFLNGHSTEHKKKIHSTDFSHKPLRYGTDTHGWFLNHYNLIRFKSGGNRYVTYDDMNPHKV